MYVPNTYDVLKAEARRLRSLAERLDSFAEEIASASEGSSSSSSSPDSTETPALDGLGEFSGMTQQEAILKALRQYGPQTTRQLFNRLNSGGQSFRRLVYVTAVAGRLMRDKIERLSDGKLRLREPQ